MFLTQHLTTKQDLSTEQIGVFFRGPLPLLTLHISNMAIASFVVVYYIPYTLQWCGVGKMTIETDSLPI
jgi:hypothetical protein